jgi:hypothetical protein
MELNPIGSDTERFYGNVDVPDGGYVGNRDGSPRIDFDHTNEALKITGNIIPIAKGLLFGEIWIEGIDHAIALAAQDVYYKVDCWSNEPAEAHNGESNGCTPDVTNDDIIILTSGIYDVRWDIAAYSAQKNTYEIEVFKNDGATGFGNTENYRTTSVASAIGAFSGGGKCRFNAGDTVELWVERKDGAGVSKTITIRKAMVSLTLIGGL